MILRNYVTRRSITIWRYYVTRRSTWRGHPSQNVDILTNKVLELVSKLVVHSSTISVLQACCAVTTEYGIPSNFVRKSTASLQIKISTAQRNFSNRNVTIFWKWNYQQRQWGTDKIITTAFIHYLYRSSYCIVSVFRNSPTFSITDIANAIFILRLSVEILNCSRE